MDIKIYPSTPQGEVVIPPSKSMAHRAIICASLADGISKISNIAYSKDIIATIEGMKKLGAKIEENGDILTIQGIKDFTNIKDRVIDCNESGSTLRFFIPIFSLTGENIRFQGRNRLLQRPQKIYETIFKEQNLRYLHRDDAIEICGKLSSGTYEIDGNVSSQFISGLLFTLPLLDGDSTIKINPPFESKSYVNLTIEMLKEFGVIAKFRDDLTIYIPGNQKYQPCNHKVEGDFSQLGFFAVLGSINGPLECKGLRKSSSQGDKQIIDIIKSAGGIVEELSDGYRFLPAPLKGTEINLEDCPDLGPILMVMGMFSSGKTHIYNAKRLRYKESDRIEAMESELKKLGVDIKSDEDNIYINGNGEYTSMAPLFSHLDHRIVMSLSVAATKLKTPTVITEAHVIEKSYPEFFKDLIKIGIKIEKVN